MQFFLHLAKALAKIVKWIENFSPLLSEKENSVFLFQFFFNMKKKVFFIFSTRFHFSIVQNLIDLIFCLISFRFIYIFNCDFCCKKNSLLSFMVWSEGCRLHQVECLSNSLIWLSSFSLRDMGLSRTVKTSERFLKLKIVWKWRFLYTLSSIDGKSCTEKEKKTRKALPASAVNVCQ